MFFILQCRASQWIPHIMIWLNLLVYEAILLNQLCCQSQVWSRSLRLKSNSLTHCPHTPYELWFISCISCCEGFRLLEAATALSTVLELILRNCTYDVGDDLLSQYNTTFFPCSWKEFTSLANKCKFSRNTVVSWPRYSLYSWGPNEAWSLRIHSMLDFYLVDTLRAQTNQMRLKFSYFFVRVFWKTLHLVWP